MAEYTEVKRGQFGPEAELQVRIALHHQMAAGPFQKGQSIFENLPTLDERRLIVAKIYVQFRWLIPLGGACDRGGRFFSRLSERGDSSEFVEDPRRTVIRVTGAAHT